MRPHAKTPSKIGDNPWSKELKGLEEDVLKIVDQDITRRGPIFRAVMAQLGHALPETGAPDLLVVLKKAKEVIRIWHGEVAWEIYNKRSPEMKIINAAIAYITGETPVPPNHV